MAKKPVDELTEQVGFCCVDLRLSKPVGQTQRNPLEYVDQHVVVERPVELRSLGQCASRAVIQHACGGMAVH